MSLPSASNESFISRRIGRLKARCDQMLRDDLRFALIALLGLFVSLTILPFTIYRFAIGSYFHGVVDSLIVLSVVSLVGYALKTGKSLLVGKMITVIASIGGAVTAIYLGWEGFVWIYPAILVSMFISTPIFGFACSMMMVAVIFGLSDHFDSLIQSLSSLSTYVLTGILSLVISWRYTVEHEELEHRAEHDSLTGVRNRFSLESSLDNAIHTVKRNQSDASVLMLDIDHFKPINDSLGHKEGDRVLRDVAGVIRDTCRAGDDICRYGGEEFLVILNHCPGAYGLAVADKIRENIESKVGCEGFDVTVSVGVTSVGPHDTHRTVVERADQNMYLAKSNGRNRCVSDAQAVAPEKPLLREASSAE